MSFRPALLVAGAVAFVVTALPGFGEDLLALLLGLGDDLGGLAPGALDHRLRLRQVVR